MKYLKLFYSFAFFFLSISLFGQDTLPGPIEPGVEITTLVDWVDIIYLALINITGFFTQFIPGLNKISSKAWRVAAIGLVLGAVFILLGWADARGLVLGFLAATNFYDLVLKGLFSKKPTEEGKEPLSIAI